MNYNLTLQNRLKRDFVLFYIEISIFSYFYNLDAKTIKVKSSQLKLDDRSHKCQGRQMEPLFTLKSSSIFGFRPSEGQSELLFQEMARVESILSRARNIAHVAAVACITRYMKADPNIDTREII